MFTLGLCLPLFTCVNLRLPCFFVFTYVCQSMLTHVYSSLTMFTLVYQWLNLFTYVYLAYIGVCLCLPCLLVHVYICDVAGENWPTGAYFIIIEFDLTNVAIGTFWRKFSYDILLLYRSSTIHWYPSRRETHRISRDMRPSTSNGTQPLAVYGCQFAERSNERELSVGVLPCNT